MANEEHRVVGAVPGPGRARIEVAFRTFEGRERIDCRVWVGTGGRSIPTKQGLSLRPEEIEPLIKLLTKAAQVAKEGGVAP